MTTSRRKQHILKVFGKEPSTPEELAQCIIKVIESQFNSSFGSSKAGKHYKVLGLAWNITFSESVSNSHNAPEGYPTNWSSKKSLPKGYPGWEGRVWIRYADHCRGFGSDPFPATLSHTGTGGGGDYNGPWAKIANKVYKYNRQKKEKFHPEPALYSWDYKIFLNDWPELVKWVEKQQIWAELSNTTWDRNHSFCWTDPDTIAADQEFLEGCEV